MRLQIDRIAVGGEGVAREPGGRVVFVRGAAPGDLVEADVVEDRPRFARARLVEVLEAGPHRMTPPCPGVAAGCGGCDLQHIAEDEQRRIKVDLVTDALARLAKIAAPVVTAARPLPAAGYRTTARVLVEHGRAAYREHHGHTGVVVQQCLVAHPLLEELLVDGRFGGAREVAIRVGARTGERLLVVHPTVGRVTVPPDVTVVGADELRAGRRAWYHEEVAGHRFRVSALSFFQARPDGADELVRLVRGAVGAAPVGRLVDLYAGVGLLAATVAAGERTLVETNRSAVADARVNVGGATIIRADVERWRPARADVVIADPARAGLGRGAVAKVLATGAGGVVLVSCDVASLGRDAGLLMAGGYHLTESVLVDLFPHTSHIETVTTFAKS
jgi:23S rRNA (uracil1939-C5)-methyltransferase